MKLMINGTWRGEINPTPEIEAERMGMEAYGRARFPGQFPPKQN